MTTGMGKGLGDVLRADQAAILQQWLDAQEGTKAMRSELLSRQELRSLMQPEPPKSHSN